MSELVLHQYPESPFSEKIRALLGYKDATYHSVATSIIMPRPDLMPLTGGYRKVPVMQMGADIFCDSAIICRTIDAMYPEKTIYPEACLATADAMAYWTDTFFFKICVAVAFQPNALATEPLFKDDVEAAAFFADRAQLTEGSSELSMSFDVAEPYFLSHLSNIDQQLAHADYLFGASPTIADFSTYHLMWFIKQREVLQDYFVPFDALNAWYARIEAFGHGNVTIMSSADALAIAKALEPDEMIDSVFVDTIVPGTEVSVMPIDYGFQAVKGELIVSGIDEIAVARTDELAGRVVVHFPRQGFQIIR